MGFRSTFVSNDTAIKWPKWFVESWVKYIHFREDCSGAISSKYEGKTYGVYQDIPEQIQKVINGDCGEFAPDSIELIFFHECGGVTKCLIGKTSIKWSEPVSWVVTDGVTHDYCYGCSDPLELK